MSHYLADLVAPLDALLLKGDADPTTRAIMCAALVLAGTPEPARLTHAFERASRAVPRMRQRVTTSGWPLGRAKWVPDDAFDVGEHIRRVGAPGDTSVEAVLDMASESATSPFDPARPLWDATLVTGVAGDRAVLLLRVHHAIADGVRALHMLANLLDLEPDPATEDLVTLEQRGSGFKAARDHVVRTSSQTVLTSQHRANSLARLMVGGTFRPVETVSTAASYANSALRTYGHGSADPSPLLRARSRARKFATLEFPLSDLRRVAKAHAATVNDVFLAGLLGGMGAYHESHGVVVTDLPVAFPIDVGGEQSIDSGNHFSAAVISGPCSVSDPVGRLEAVHELVVSRRAEPGVDAPLRLAPVLHQAPTWLTAPTLKAYARRVDLQASNIVGPDCAVYLSGTKVERFYAFGPLPGIPVMAVLVSHEGICTLGFTVDPAAVTDLAGLMDCTRTSFADLMDA